MDTKSASYIRDIYTGELISYPFFVRVEASTCVTCMEEGFVKVNSGSV